MSQVVPFLWFDHQAAEAAAFYTSVFRNSVILATGNGSSTVRIEGQVLILFNGGPHFKFTPAVSLMVSVESQSELDEIWARLSAEESAERCGWLKDKFGFSWQIVPGQLSGWLGSGDAEKSERVRRALMQMKKLDIAGLKRAFVGE